MAKKNQYLLLEFLYLSGYVQTFMKLTLIELHFLKKKKLKEYSGNLSKVISEKYYDFASTGQVLIEKVILY